MAKLKKTAPPFRAEMVGSLLRSAALKAARAKYDNGQLTASQLKQIEDREIEKIVKKQEEIGLQLATDGEFRRAWWHFDFLKRLEGVELFDAKQGIQFNGVQKKAENVRVTGKLDFPSDHPMLDHFRFLKSHTRLFPKMTIPSPSLLHYRGGRAAISRDVYPDLDLFFEDLGKTYRKAVQAFYDAGCRYLQFDDTIWAYLCSSDQQAKARARGEDLEKLPSVYARAINYALQEKPHDMVITTHVCRGNFRSTWISEGGYEPIAELLLASVNYDGYFLEYDTERAGGFEPLRFLPKGEKIVVLGLVTSKSGILEKEADIERRIEEATKYVALNQFCLSPQCGFASTEEGNRLSEEEQWAKLGMVVEIAEKVWGKS